MSSQGSCMYNGRFVNSRGAAAVGVGTGMRTDRRTEYSGGSVPGNYLTPWLNDSNVPPFVCDVLPSASACNPASSTSAGAVHCPVSTQQSEPRAAVGKSQTTGHRRPRGTAATRSGGATATRRPAKPRPAYKHIPHRDKPPHLVARRNARERRRVQAVNGAFVRLRRHLPYPVSGKNKRLSKVKTLRFAIDYISHLQRLLNGTESERSVTTVDPTTTHIMSDDYIKQQQQQQPLTVAGRTRNSNNNVVVASGRQHRNDDELPTTTAPVSSCRPASWTRLQCQGL